MAQAEQRMYFGRQPARVLLVDLSAPLDEDVCQGVVVALEKCLSLVSSLMGPPRLSFFGLYALGNYPEALIPLQHTRGSYSRLQSSLHELLNCHHDYSSNKPPTSSCIAQGVQEAAATFKQQAHNLLQTSSSGGNWSQYEMTIVTCQMAHSVIKQVEKATRDIDTENLKKIQVLQICSADRLFALNDMSSQISNGSDNSDTSINALIDSVAIDFSAVALENYFKGWLHDVSTDSEHMHIILPGEEEPLVLKCDLHERILDPSLVPFPHQYSVHPGTFGMRVNPTAPTAKGGGISVPVHRLKVINRIPLDGVCESVLHGMPLVVKATMCWKVEWDELETNQHNFLSLCTQLNKQGEVLLCQLEADPPAPPARPGGGFRYHVPPPKPRGFFLVLPSSGSTLLIKSVADADLTLPADVMTLETPSTQCEAVIRNSLEKVAPLEMYNPLLQSSGLTESLVVQLTRSAPSGGTKRKGPAPYNQQVGNDRTSRPGIRAPGLPTRGRGGSSYPTRSSGAQWQGSRSSGPQDPSKRARYPVESGDNFYSKSFSDFPTNL